MHNFFEAKGRKLEARRRWGFREGRRDPPPTARGLRSAYVSFPSGRKRISVYFELENRIWRQLFRLFISAEKVEMVHFETLYRSILFSVAVCQLFFTVLMNE